MNEIRIGHTRTFWHKQMIYSIIFSQKSGYSDNTDSNPEGFSEKKRSV